MRTFTFLGVSILAVTMAGSALASVPAAKPVSHSTSSSALETDTFTSPFGTNTWSLTDADFKGPQLQVNAVYYGGASRSQETIIVGGGPGESTIEQISTDTNRPDRGFMCTYWATKNDGKILMTFVLSSAWDGAHAMTAIIAVGETKTVRMFDSNGKKIAVFRISPASAGA